MNKLNPWRIGSVTALTTALISVVCAVAVYLFPEGTVNFVNSWTHGLDLTMLKSERQWTLGGLAYGLFNVALTGFVTGAPFAFFFNLVGRARDA